MMQPVLIPLLEAEAVCASALLAALAGLMLTRTRTRRRREQAAAARPAIREALSNYMGGNDDLSRLRKLKKAQREELAHTLVDLQSRVGGPERERLVHLALEFRFVADWCDEAESRDPGKRRQALGSLAAMSHSPMVSRLAAEIRLRALGDPDEQVRIQACALVHSENRRLIEKGFELALAASPLVRLQVAPQPRRHAEMLCQSAVPKALRAGKASDLVKILKLLASWECQLPLADLSLLAAHIDDSVRLETMRLLALAPPTVANRRALLDGLMDAEPRVVMAAAISAGRLRLPAVLPRLTSCLRRGHEALAHTAAMVLAEMPPLGWQSLEHHLTSSDPIASAAARKALETARAESMDSGSLKEVA